MTHRSRIGLFAVTLLALVPLAANACLEWKSSRFGTYVRNNCRAPVNFVFCLGKGCQPAFFDVVKLLPANEFKVADQATAGEVAYCKAPKKPTEQGCQ